ncbi:MAG: hypothetical protein R2824_25265 [Saprospiraceae bacterium]|nr:hypothetical protein [Lewinella sp.]
MSYNIATALCSKRSGTIFHVQLIAGLLLLPLAIAAQRIDIPQDFNQLLEQVDAYLILPVEDGGYKDIRPFTNRWLNYDFSIRSRKERLEIRYKVVPYKEQDLRFHAPHVLAMQAMMQVATNDEEAIVSSLAISEKSLKEDYFADWGQLFTFVPKLEFSQKSTCQMVSLYREGKGMILLFFLFDRAPAQLDYRRLAISFGEGEVGF